MPGRRFSWLLRKEMRELIASRAYLVLLILAGLLVGESFITAVGLYAEASRGTAGVPELAANLKPLEGFLVPTFGAYDLAATLLWPFVAIRLLSAEKQRGGLALMLQTQAGIAPQIAAKALVLLAGWVLAFLPGLLCLGLWRVYGGHLHGPEVLNLLLGHLLRGFLASAVAILAAALAENVSSAAILALAFTLGAWALDFTAAGRSGWVRALGTLTPSAILRGFEQGLLSAGAVLSILVMSLGFLFIAGIFLHPGRPLPGRILRGTGVLLLTTALMLGATRLRPAMDVSEDRRNSFSPAVENSLRSIRKPLLIEIGLAPEDPRYLDLDQSLLSKLRRAMPDLDLRMTARTRSGRFESATDHYGEVWYQLCGRREMSRSTSEEEVLPLIFNLAGRPLPAPDSAPPPSGHPLVAHPRGAAWLCFGLWPLLVLLGFGWVNRPRRTP